MKTAALALIMATGLLAACGIGETRTAPYLFIQGPKDRVERVARDLGARYDGTLSSMSENAAGETEARVTFAIGASTTKTSKAMMECIEARLNCAVVGESVTRSVS